MDSFVQSLATNAMFQQQGNSIHNIAGELMKARPQDAVAAAKEFESVFVSQMLRHMFDQVEVDEVFGGGSAEETWRGLLVDEYGKMITKTGGIGVADQVQRELLKLQGA